MATSLSGCFKSKKSADENQQSTANQEEKEESFFGSMQDLLTHGKSVKCAYKSDGNGDKEANGVLYVAGNKTRSEMNITEEKTGKKLEINSIIIGDWMYIWNNFMPQGTKMNIKEMQGEVDENYSQGEVDKMKEKMDYKCRPWIPDNSKFDIPTDIEFSDMTEMMKGFQDTMGNINMDEMKKSGEEAKQKLCDMCEMLTGQAREQCRTDAECE